MSAWNISLWVIVGLCLVLLGAEIATFRGLVGASRARRVRGRVRLMRRISGIVLVLLLLAVLGLEGWLAGPDATPERKLLYFGVCFILAGLLIAFVLWDLRATGRDALKERIELAEESVDLLSRIAQRNPAAGGNKLRRQDDRNNAGESGASSDDKK